MSPLSASASIVAVGACRAEGKKNGMNRMNPKGSITKSWQPVPPCAELHPSETTDLKPSEVHCEVDTGLLDRLKLNFQWLH